MYNFFFLLFAQIFHQHYAKEKHLAALIHKESISLLQGLGIGEGAMEKVTGT